MYCRPHLNLEPFEEQITAALAVYSPRVMPVPGQQNTIRSKPHFGCSDAGSGGSMCSQYFFGQSVDKLTKVLYQASRVSRIWEEKDHIIEPSMREPAFHPKLRRWPIFQKLRAEEEHWPKLFLNRTSVRHYTNDPVSLTQLAGMLAPAYDGDRNDWPDDSCIAPLKLLVLASRIEWSPTWRLYL